MAGSVWLLSSSFSLYLCALVNVMGPVSSDLATLKAESESNKKTLLLICNFSDLTAWAISLSSQRTQSKQLSCGWVTNSSTLR